MDQVMCQRQLTNEMCSESDEENLIQIITVTKTSKDSEFRTALVRLVSTQSHCRFLIFQIYFELIIA